MWRMPEAMPTRAQCQETAGMAGLVDAKVASMERDGEVVISTTVEGMKSTIKFGLAD